MEYTQSVKKVTDYDDNSVTLVCTLVYTNAIDSWISIFNAISRLITYSHGNFRPLSQRLCCCFAVVGTARSNKGLFLFWLTTRSVCAFLIAFFSVGGSWLFCSNAPILHIFEEGEKNTNTCPRYSSGLSTFMLDLKMSFIYLENFLSDINHFDIPTY